MTTNGENMDTNGQRRRNMMARQRGGETMDSETEGELNRLHQGQKRRKVLQPVNTVGGGKSQPPAHNRSPMVERMSRPAGIQNSDDSILDVRKSILGDLDDEIFTSPVVKPSKETNERTEGGKGEKMGRGEETISSAKNPPTRRGSQGPIFLRGGPIHTWRVASSEAPRGRGVNLVNWDTEGGSTFTPLSSNVTNHVSNLGWNLSGAIVMMGSTATGADKPARVGFGDEVEGAIPNAVRWIRSTAIASRNLGGRKTRLAVVMILGKEDHLRITRSLISATKGEDSILDNTLEAIGAPTGTTIESRLHGDDGSPFAFTVTFPDETLKVDGEPIEHLLYLHSTRALGGGKSDEAMKDGKLDYEAKHLASEFQWWKIGLQAGSGVIGSVESTLGGTARTGRYSLLAADIPRMMLTPDSFEAIGVDDGDWVRDNLGSEDLPYRTNFNTTLLRGVHGTVGRRFPHLRLELVNRNDESSRRLRRMRSAVAVLRNIHSGHPELELLRGDLSDERMGMERELGITDNEHRVIIDPVNGEKWLEYRRTFLTTSFEIPSGAALEIAAGEDDEQTRDYADEAIRRMHSLPTSESGKVPPGGFIQLQLTVDQSHLDGTGEGYLLSTDHLNTIAERLGHAFDPERKRAILLSIRRSPRGWMDHPGAVLVQVLEEQSSTNILINSTEDAALDRRRVTMSNPMRSEDEQVPVGRWRSQRPAFSVLFKRMIEAHQVSGHRAAVTDSEMLRSFYRHWYSGGNLPAHYPGGNTRPRADEERRAGVRRRGGRR